MAENSKLCYKICREMAGLTQDEVCYHLNISEVSTLSKYENGHLKVDDALVRQMAALYRNKKLPLLHCLHLHPLLTEFIPDPKELQGDGENVMYFQLASDKLKAVKKKAKKYLINDGRLDEKEIENLMKEVPTMKKAISEAMNFVSYIENQSLKMEQK